MPAAAPSREAVAAPALSVVLPISGEASHVDRRIRDYAAALDGLEPTWELVLVPDGAQGTSVCGRLAREDERMRVCAPTHGWGAAVRAGLRASRGETLCYANYGLTAASVLSQALTFALRNPSLVVRANRRTRDTMLHRIGSLLFNLECRALLGLSTWDVNGTPKVFPRAFSKLMDLSCDDELFDVEFTLVCERERYPVIELPIVSEAAPGWDSSPSMGAALRMYTSVLRLKRR